MSSTSQAAQITAWLRHIHALAGEIGPRGSTTEGERRGSRYCAEQLTGLGYAPQIEGFDSARSLFLVHFYVAACMLAAFLIYPWAGRSSAGLALLLAGVAMTSEVLELLFRDNPLRRLIPHGRSQNVWAICEPSQQHRQDLVLMGHVDTNHSPLIFRSTRWINFWRIASTIIFNVFMLQVPVYFVGVITPEESIWWFSIPSAICAVLLAALMLEAELAPYSPGANDNATAAGLVLALAEVLREQPLPHTRVWLVCTGCEEVKHYGAIDFYRRHASELHNPTALVFEMLGHDGPAWLLKEGTIGFFNYHSDPELVALCEQIAASHPELGGHPTQVGGGHTEMADALRAGIPAITLIGLDEGGTRFGYDGPEVYWHRIDDTPDKINPEVLTRNYAFVNAFIQALDYRASTRTP